MKSNIKKILSTSMASLTVFSSLGGLSAVKINAAPPATISKDNTAEENEIEFTLEDIIDIGHYYEDVNEDFKKLVDYVPNLSNFLKVDENLDNWKESLILFVNTLLTIIGDEQSSGFYMDELECFRSKHIPVGNTINEIRKIFKRNPHAQEEIKQVVIKFMEDHLGITNSESNKKMFKKIRKFFKVRNYLVSTLENIDELNSDVEIKNLKEKICSKMQHPSLKKLKDIALEVLKAKEELQAENPAISKSKKVSFLNAKDHFYEVMYSISGEILMANLDKKEPEYDLEGLEEIDFSEEISQEEILRKERESQIAEQLKEDLKKAIISDNLDYAKESERIFNDMETKITDQNLKNEIIDWGFKVLKEYEELSLKEFKESMSDILHDGLLKDLKTIKSNKDKSEESEKECASTQEDQKDMQEEKVTQQSNKDEKVFTFEDLNEWMQNEKSQEKFESKMMEVCNLIDTIGNREIWYACLDQFEKCFESLTEDFTKEEKTELCKKVMELPIAGIFDKLRNIILERLPEKEYLKAVSEFLGVPMKIKPEEPKEKPIKPEIPAEDTPEIKEKPAKVKPQEKTEQPKIAPQKENAQNSTAPAKIEKVKKPEIKTKNQSNVDSKPAVTSIKQEKTKNKKSFWSFILDLLEKLPLIGKLIHFLRK